MNDRLACFRPSAMERRSSGMGVTAMHAGEHGGRTLDFEERREHNIARRQMKIAKRGATRLAKRFLR